MTVSMRAVLRSAAAGRTPAAVAADLGIPADLAAGMLDEAVRLGLARPHVGQSTGCGSCTTLACAGCPLARRSAAHP